MLTSVHTNIILDVLIPGESFSESSKALLDRHSAKGELIICEIVFAELAAAFPSEEQLRAFLSDTGMKVVHSIEESLFVAGSRWAEYAKKVPGANSCAPTVVMLYGYPARNVKQESPSVSTSWRIL